MVDGQDEARHNFHTLHNHSHVENLLYERPAHSTMQAGSMVLTSDTPKATITRPSSDRSSRIFTHVSYPIKREREVLEF